MDRNQYDVIVVGAGGAGLAAGLAAVQSGARTLILERGQKPGGTTAMSTGFISSSRTRSQRLAGVYDDSPEVHFQDMKKVDTGGRNNEALTRVLAHNLPQTIAWLEETGINFAGPFPAPASSKTRLMVTLPNASALIFHLSRAFAKAGGELRAGSGVDDVIFENDRVTGVICGSDRLMASRAVILASGDFSNHKELRRHYLPQYENLPPVNPGSVGTGFDMGLRLGSTIENGSVVRAGQLRFAPPPGDNGWIAKLPPHRWITEPMRLAVRHLPMALLKPFMMPFLATYMTPSEALVQKGLCVFNKSGQNVSDEGAGIGFAVAKQPEHKAYILLDSRLMQFFSEPPNALSAAVGAPSAYLRDYERYRPDLVTRGVTLEDLANRLGVPGDALAETVASKAIDHKGPYVAIGPVEAVITTTMGGLRVDEKHNVLRSDGSIIGGLLAAGSVGYGGIVIVGMGHNLGWAFTSGRLAGVNAASAT